MQQYFAEYGLHPATVESFAEFVAGDARLALVVSPLQAGFAWPAARLAFVTEAELYAHALRRGKREAARRTNVDAMVRDLSEVRIGDPVVHEQHGAPVAGEDRHREGPAAHVVTRSRTPVATR